MAGSALDAETVRQIRARLDLSRDGLAALIDVTSDTIKRWEDGARNCAGPSRLVLLLLERAPNILDVLNGDPEGLPNPDAIPGTPEWFQLQRLVNLIGYGVDYNYWCELYVEEGLNEDWLYQLELRQLVSRSPRNPEIRRRTRVAELKLHARAWRSWCKSLDAELTNDTGKLPLMTPELLEKFQ